MRKNILRFKSFLKKDITNESNFRRENEIQSYDNFINNQKSLYEQFGLGDIVNTAKNVASTVSDTTKTVANKTSQVVNKSSQLAKDLADKAKSAGSKAVETSKWVINKTSDKTKEGIKYVEKEASRLKGCTGTGSNEVVVDFFSMGQKEAGGGFGHIQAWSKNDDEYQINAMPKKADVTSVLFKPGSEEATMYNQVVHELDKLEKTSIILKMNSSEYDHFKKFCGDWAGKYINEVKNHGKSEKGYNLIFSNCTLHTLKAVIPSEALAVTYAVGSVSFPGMAFNFIKSHYVGCYTQVKGGYRKTKK